jgi:hypothetical protein
MNARFYHINTIMKPGGEREDEWEDDQNADN